MNDESRLKHLQALVKSQYEVFAASPSQFSQDKLMETLQIYQAELELQNQQLLETQQALQLQKQHYSQLFQLQPVANILLDRQGVIKDLNSLAVKLLATTKPRLIGSSVFRFLTEDAGIWLQDKLQLDGSKTVTQHQSLIELAVQRQRRQQCRVNLALLPTNNQLDAHVILTLEDVTRETMIESERVLFKTMLDNSHALIFAVDSDFNLLVANRAFYKLHKLQPQFANMVNVRDIFPEESVQRLQSLYDTVFIRGIPVTYEYHYTVEDKNKFFQTSGFPLKNDHGVITGAGFITTDISDKMNAEIRLQTAMQVFSEGAEAVVITDRALNITQVNQSFCVLFGCTERVATNQNLANFLKVPLNDDSQLEIRSRLAAEGFWDGEVLAKRFDNSELPVWIRLSRVPKEGEFRNYLVIVTDLSEAKAREAHISRLAYYDSLTGLANRLLLRDRIESLLKRAQHEKTIFSLLYLDLDHFKDINDVHGHDIGDDLLVQVAARLNGLFRSSDLICRLGGDEFIVLLAGTPAEVAQEKAAQLVQGIGEPYLIPPYQLFVTASVGVVSYPGQGTNYAELMQHADLAMYSAKQAGKATHKHFTVELMDAVKRRYAMQGQLKQALAAKEFTIVYQPIFSAGTAPDIAGVEALLRWTNPLFGAVPPDEFIPLLEESSLIIDVGDWVLEQSCQTVLRLNKKLNKTLYCSVNISSVQLWSQGFEQRIQDILDRTGIPFSEVKLELTERVAMEKPQQAALLMARLATVGVRFALDDFGTGYSSLAYLKYLPIHTLKIDRSFVKDIGRDKDDEVIIRALVLLANSMNISTTAEGVETEEQLQFLSALGCNELQGYYLSRPLSEDSLQLMLGAEP